MVVREKRTTETWSVAEAKFTEVVERATHEGPQRVTKNGRDAVVSSEEWARKSARQGNLAEFFDRSPLRGSGIDLERVRDAPRDVNL